MLDASASNSSPDPQDPTLEVPKDDQGIRITSPPPAYAPPPGVLNLQRLAELHLARVQMQAAAQNLGAAASDRVNVNRHLTTNVLAEPCQDAEFETDEQLLGSCGSESPLSPFSLRVNTSINITKSNNIVCIGEVPPADHANVIAKAVVTTMQENSTARSGIPMIDEEGRPRPINIEIDASMLVEGCGNIVGSTAAVKEILRQQALTRQTRPCEEDEQNVGSPSKRRRSSK